MHKRSTHPSGDCQNDIRTALFILVPTFVAAGALVCAIALMTLSLMALLPSFIALSVQTLLIILAMAAFAIGMQLIAKPRPARPRGLTAAQKSAMVRIYGAAFTAGAMVPLILTVNP